jgi:hypothetical protein
MASARQGGKLMVEVGKLYLGDAVYAAFDGYHLVLTTENGIAITNAIFLEPNVVKALELYLDKLKAAIKRANDAAGPDQT